MTRQIQLILAISALFCAAQSAQAQQQDSNSNRAQLEEALTACHAEVQKKGLAMPERGQPPETDEELDGMAAFRSCMEEKGFTEPPRGPHPREREEGRPQRPQRQKGSGRS